MSDSILLKERQTPSEGQPVAGEDPSTSVEKYSSAKYVNVNLWDSHAF